MTNMIGKKINYSMVKMVIKEDPIGKISVGRERLRREDLVKEDIKNPLWIEVAELI